MLCANFPYAGLAPKHDESPSSREGILQRRLQLTHLPLPAHEDSPRQTVQRVGLISLGSLVGRR